MSLKIGIVGTGNVAKRNYVPFLAAQPDVELAYFNRTRTKAETLAADLGGQVFGSLAELMSWSPDTVFVLTAETARLEMADALLDLKPRRLYFEKPLVARAGQAHVTEQDFTDGRRILKRASEIGCESAIMFNYRFFEQTMLAKCAVAERGFGRLVNVTALVHFACWSHLIDLVHYFAGPIAEICALQSVGNRSGANMEAVDVAAAIRTVGDATGTLIGTAGLQWDFPLYELVLNFEGGHIRMQGLDGELEIMDGKAKRHEVICATRDRSRWDEYNNSFKRAIGAYLDALRLQQPPPVPATLGLQELQVEAALKRSIAQRRPVVLADEFPLD